MKLRSKLSAMGTLNLSACKNQTILFVLQYACFNTSRGTPGISVECRIVGEFLKVFMENAIYTFRQ